MGAAVISSFARKAVSYKEEWAQKSGASYDTPLAGDEAYTAIKTESVRFPVRSW